MSRGRIRESHRRMDRRAMESVMSKVGKLMKEQNFESLEDAQRFLNEKLIGLNLDKLEIAPKTPLDRAQNLVYRAFEERSRTKRVSMAEKAIAISPDCADAYVILAEDKSRSLEEAIGFYREAVEAGRRALGEDVIRDPDTMFWADHSTRPLIRAMVALAEALVFDRQKDEAAEILSEVLRLNPRDNGGARLTLVPVLLELGKLDEAEAILSRFPDDIFAHMYFSRALLLFAREGKTPRANAALESALKWNSYVLETFLGRRKLSSHDGPFSPHSPEEADHYIMRGLGSWDEIPGALSWLQELVIGRVRRTTLDVVFPGNEFIS